MDKSHSQSRASEGQHSSSVKCERGGRVTDAERGEQTEGERGEKIQEFQLPNKVLHKSYYF